VQFSRELPPVCPTKEIDSFGLGQIVRFGTRRREAVKMPLELKDHPSDEVLEEYCLDRLPPAILESVQDHLFVCETCQDTVLETDEYIRLMKFAMAEGAPQPLARMPPARAWDNLTAAGKKSGLGSATTWTAITLASLMTVIWTFTSFRTNLPLPAIPVRLVAMRGGEDATFARAPAGRPLSLAIDTTGLTVPDSYRVEIVRSGGQPVWNSDANASGREIVASTPKPMKAGIYWVRLYSSNDDRLVREYGLKLE